MSHEAVGNWIENAKSAALAAPRIPNMKTGGRMPKSKGNIIMEMAERFFPWLMKMTDGVRDKNGLPVQPAHVRAIALNLAQRIVNEQESHA